MSPGVNMGDQSTKSLHKSYHYKSEVFCGNGPSRVLSLKGFENKSRKSFFIGNQV
jgi:hypothetical protein